jgi:predicted ester cyclase
MFAVFTAFPDSQVSTDDLMAEGDKVCYRMTIRGVHKAELMGIPATNKAITVRAIGIARVSGDQIVEEWENFDELGMMQQLGVIPSEH